MNDVIISDKLKKNIAFLLLEGKDTTAISKELKCSTFEVLEVLNGADFCGFCEDFLHKTLLKNGIKSLQNVVKIANSRKTSPATKLKANMYLADKSMDNVERGKNSESPATMTQEQLALKLKELQSEALKRAKPIDTGVDDMISMFD